MNVTTAEFCRKKRIVRKWKRNATNLRNKEQALLRFNSDDDSSFGGAFFWNTTPEGDAFWAELSEEFDTLNEEK